MLPPTWFRALSLAVLALAIGRSSAAPADSLALGLVACLPCDEDLRWVTPAGEEGTAGFTRPSLAWDDALQPVPLHEPRLATGRFGRGILLEPGAEADEPRCGRNWLPPEVAEVIPRPGLALAFQPVREATVTVIQATPAEWRGLTEPILEGLAALHLTATMADGGAEMRTPVVVPPGEYTASTYARVNPDAPADDRLILEVVDADSGAVLSRGERVLDGTWRRLETPLVIAATGAADGAPQDGRAIRLRAILPRVGQVALLDALMLERRGEPSPAGTGSASSWLPGHAARAAERLDLDDLRPALTRQTGTIAFWICRRGEPQARRTLVELASPKPWQPHLHLTLLDDRVLHLGRRSTTPETARGEVSWAPGSWHHLAVTWTATTAAVHVDGVRTAAIDGLEIPPRPAGITLGSGRADTAAQAVLDDILVYDRVLDDAEIARLAKAAAPSGGLALPAVTLRPERFVAAIARGREPQLWRGELRHRGTAPLEAVDITFRLGPAMALTRRLASLPPGHVGPVEFVFLADLAVGTYPLSVTAVAADRELARFSRRVEITPAAEPAGNLHILAAGDDNADRTYGFTAGGGDLLEAMRQGLAWAPTHRYLGIPRRRVGEDRVVTLTGQPGMTRLTSPAMADQARRESERWAMRLAGVPALRAVTLNREAQWIHDHDFTPETVTWIRQTFHLDLDAWRHPPDGDPMAHQLPIGRLRPSVAGIGLPADRIVDPRTPVYAYHRWFHGPVGPTESWLNQVLSDALHARRPDVLTLQDAILRRPPLRAFERLSVAQEGFSCAEPLRGVLVQEGLNAAVRRTALRPSGQPQLLLPAGTAAPFNALATADLFREATWLCVLQPIRLLTCRDAEALLMGPTETHWRGAGPADLERLFGTPAPTWAEAQRALEASPEMARTLLARSDDLLAALRRVLTAEVAPLGALVPAWRNRPRRLAMVRSFASQLYSEDPWPATTWLEGNLLHSGVPFDILWDDDPEADPEALAGYRLVVVSAAACLTRPMVEALTRLQSVGGVVLTDSETRVTLPGAVVVQAGDAAAAAAMPYGPTGNAAAGTGPVGAATPPRRPPDSLALAGPGHPEVMSLIERHLDPEARSLSPFTWMNLLEAEGACYLGVVNDLRVHGPLYGHFGLVRESGIAQTARLAIQPHLGAVAYDLVRHQAVPLRHSGAHLMADLDLGPGEGRVLVLLPAAIARLDLAADLQAAEWGDHRGRQIGVRAGLRDAEGRIVPGIIPATITVLHPDGSRNDLSHHTAFRRGLLETALPVPSNAPPGPWRVQVRDHASGRRAEAVVTVR